MFVHVCITKTNTCMAFYYIQPLFLEYGIIFASEMRTQTCILTSVKQIASPGWMHETSARGWCAGITQRDGMGRELEGGSGWGTHVNPWLIHVNVWQKPLQYCKVISLQLIKIIGKK